MTDHSHADDKMNDTTDPKQTLLDGLGGPSGMVYTAAPETSTAKDALWFASRGIRNSPEACVPDIENKGA